MPTKEQIIENIRDYSAADIVQAIKCGDVSLYELSKSGALTPLIKKRIEEQLAGAEQIDATVDSNESEVEPAEANDRFEAESSSNSEQPEAAVLASSDDMLNVPSDVAEAVATPVAVEKKYSAMIRELFSFKGRLGRLHYFLSIVASYALLILSIFLMADLSKESVLWGFVGAIIMFFSLWFIIASRVKRCHDRGKSGWWQLYTAIPYVGVIFNMILLFGSGDIDENEYGPNPRNQQ